MVVVVSDYVGHEYIIIAIWIEVESALAVAADVVTDKRVVRAALYRETGIAVVCDVIAGECVPMAVRLHVNAVTGVIDN